MLVNKLELGSYQEEEIETIIEEEKRRRKIKRKQENVSSKILAIILAIIGLALSIYILHGYTNITKMRLEISDLENTRYLLERDRKDLIAELEYIKNTAKIEENARIKLGMDYPNEEQIVYLSIENPKDEMVVENSFSITNQFKNVVNLIIGYFRGA